MQNLNDLFYFVQVVTHGGYAAAARITGVQKSTLSRHITNLEEFLQATLIYRSSRRFALTEVGAEYYRQCLVVLENIEAAQRIIDRNYEEPNGTIRIVCPVGPLNYKISDLITEFMQHFPKVDVHLKCMNRNVDVIGEGYDLVIREDNNGHHENNALVTRVIGTNPQCLVAGKDLFSDASPPAEPKDLAGFPTLAFGFPKIERAVSAGRPHYEWSFRDERGRAQRIRHVPRLITDSHETLRNAVIRGLGIAQLPLWIVSGDIKTGQLIQLLPDYRLNEPVIHAVYPATKAQAPNIRALVGYLSESLSLSRQ